MFSCTIIPPHRLARAETEKIYFAAFGNSRVLYARLPRVAARGFCVCACVRAWLWGVFGENGKREKGQGVHGFFSPFPSAFLRTKKGHILPSQKGVRRGYFPRLLGTLGKCYLFIVDNMRIFGGIFYTKKGGIFCETVSVRSPSLPSKFHRTPKPSFPRVLFSENHRSIGENFKKQRVQKFFIRITN